MYQAFARAAADAAKAMRQGHALGEAPVDCGAMCLPGLAERVAELVDDAVAAGAQVPALTTCACVQGAVVFGTGRCPLPVAGGIGTWRRNCKQKHGVQVSAFSRT